MPIPSHRQLVDATFVKSKSYPAAGATNYLDSYVDTNSVLVYLPIDISLAGPFRNENCFIEGNDGGKPGRWSENNMDPAGVIRRSNVRRY